MVRKPELRACQLALFVGWAALTVGPNAPSMTGHLKSCQSLRSFQYVAVAFLQVCVNYRASSTSDLLNYFAFLVVIFLRHLLSPV